MIEHLPNLLAPKFFILYAFIASAMYVHYRGRVRHRFYRQLTDHSTFMAPYNVLMYMFSAVPNRPYVDVKRVPRAEEAVRQLADAARGSDAALRRGPHPRRGEIQRPGLQFVFPARLEALLRQVVRRSAAVGDGAVPEDGRRWCSRFRRSTRRCSRCCRPAAIWASIAIRSPDRCAITSGLSTPNSENCRIFVDGEPYHWRDGEAVIFDETFIHWAENKTDQLRVILFCDVERPLTSRIMATINHWYEAPSSARARPRTWRATTSACSTRSSAFAYYLRLPAKALKRKSKFAYYAVKWLLLGGLLYWIFA